MVRKRRVSSSTNTHGTEASGMMGFSISRFLGPSSTLIALLVGGWYLLRNAPPPDALNLPESPPVASNGAFEDLLQRFNPQGSPNPGQTTQTSAPATPSPQNPAARTTAIPAAASRTMQPNSPTATRSTQVAPGQGPGPASSPGTARASNRIRIASFNIRDFGPKKLNNPNVMSVLASIVSRFDVVGIQEISSVDQPVVERLLAIINRSGATYSGITSPRIGVTSQKEQYAFIWHAGRIQHVPQSEYVVQDPAERMHREPYVASFQVRLSPQSPIKPFRFTLINVHTDPDLVTAEMNVLDDVFRSIRAYEYPEDDIILMGDLNANTSQLGELGRIPGMVTLCGNGPTNTRGDRQYDHILIDRYLTSEFIPGQSGVFSYEQELGFSVQQALEISDHCPIWAEFGIEELPPGAPAIAATPARGP